ncbi:MAG: flavin reductase family protein [Bacteroidetes bacterium]|nr:flavin reductase family protein [Bacteroidota bacterium]
MNKLLRKILLGYSNPQKYPAIRVKSNEIKERVLLYSEGKISDITANHSIVCEKPFCIAIFFLDGQQAFNLNKIEIRVERGAKVVAKLKLTLKDQIDAGGTSVFIYEIDEAKTFQLSNVRQYFLMRYFLREKKLTEKEGKIYAALYSYPREVVIISYEEDGYYNMFPMDFRRYYELDNLYVFGLRSTNITLGKILESGKLVACNTDAAKLEDIYYLGRHHSTMPPQKNDMPFELVKSELYAFPVPAFSASYKEVKIINSKKIGSHVLMIGKVVNKKEIRPDECSVYHIHFFEYVKAGYRQL